MYMAALFTTPKGRNPSIYQKINDFEENLVCPEWNPDVWVHLHCFLKQHPHVSFSVQKSQSGTSPKASRHLVAHFLAVFPLSKPSYNLLGWDPRKG